MAKIPFPEPEYSARKQQPGRNDPCPCGSGKKYKQCCMSKDSQHSSSELLWRRLGETSDKLANQLLNFFMERLDSEALMDAWSDYLTLRAGRDFDPDDPEIQCFMPWMFYNWSMQFTDGNPETDEIDEKDTPSTIAEYFLAANRRRLTEMEKRFIQLSVSTNFSFYEVVDCQPGKGFTLRDLLLSTEVYVYERAASTDAQPGDVIFAKVVRYDDVATINGCGTVLIPPRHKPLIIDLREAMREGREHTPLDGEDLQDWEFDIRDLYHDIFDYLTNPPQIHNTDGDLIVWHELIFALKTTPEAAFAALKPLALDIPEEELLEEAEYDPDGSMFYIDFPWLKKERKQASEDDYTTLGEITIEGKEIYVTVNSEKRAKKIRKEIEKRLGKQVAFLEMEVKTIDEIMTDAPDEPSGTIPPEAYTPEMNAAIDQMMARHWESWPDEKVPVLGNITPRQAAKTKAGREKLAAILDDMEFRERKNPLPGMSQLKHILKIREELGV
ncbi:MAG: SEC-C domain-containing protein [Calditrichaeota bacterium]|nr:SEC-C domain-containing protein [Calditrichota bacterium]MCB9088256.1 SEC-C domain-containing protein [Calditrichia bacterium]